MRLYKKVAVCLLAAAMALSMLTGCFGGGENNPGDNNPGGGGNPGSSTVEPALKPDEIILPGDDDKDESKPAKTPIDPASSRLAAYNNRYDNASECYMETVESVYDANNGLLWEQVQIFARKNGDIYKKRARARTSRNEFLEIVVQRKDNHEYEEYYLLRDSQVALKVAVMEQYLVESQLPVQMWSTKVKVGGTEYYAETYNYDHGVTTICYDAAGMPKYNFTRYEGGDLRITTYRNIRFGAGSSQGLCRIPAGFKSYMIGADSQDNVFLTDAQGKQYAVDIEYWNGIYKNLNVIDESGNDVTNNFGWVRSLYDGSFDFWKELI